MTNQNENTLENLQRKADNFVLSMHTIGTDCPKIKVYTLMNGTIKYKASYFLGKDPISLKDRQTTLRADTLNELFVQIQKMNELKANRLLLETFKSSVAAPSFKDIYKKWDIFYKTNVEPSTYGKTKSLFRNHILPSFGDKKIQSIKTKECSVFVEKVQNHFKNPQKVIAYARNVFDFAQELEIINKNPMNSMFLTKKANTTTIAQLENSLLVEQFYTPDEFKAFNESNKELYEKVNYMKFTLFNLLGHTGLRIGEILALEWKDLNEETKELAIVKALSISDKHQLYLKVPKGRKPRFVSLDNKTFDILLKWKELQCKALTLNKQPHHEEKQLIFMNTKNNYIHPKNVQRWINKIQEAGDLKHITPRKLRHTHCIYCFSLGLSPREVMHRLGHKTLTTTLSYYDKYDVHTRKKAADKINQSNETYVLK